MKKNNSLLNILIILVINVALLFFDYYIGVDLFKMLSDKWYVLVLIFFMNALIVNPFITYLIDYYLILNHI